MADTAALMLTPADIPGADLCEPFQSHTIPALRWWLLCRGVCTPTSWNKKKIIDRYILRSANASQQLLLCRIHETIAAGTSVVDVDGSYMYKKLKAITNAEDVTVTMSPPAPPPSGWVTITEDNYLTIAQDLPAVTAG